MKKIMLCTLFGVLMLLSSCSDDKFSENSLFQSQWSGALQFIEDSKEEKCNVTISFETQERGRYATENLNHLDKYSDKTTIEYSVQDEIITIFGGVNNVLHGDWWIEKYSKNRLILIRYPNTGNESRLTLNKL